MKGSVRRAPLLLGLFAVAALQAAWAQQQPTRLEPELPKSGDSVGTRPKFVLRTNSEDVSKLRFKIEM